MKPILYPLYTVLTLCLCLACQGEPQKDSAQDEKPAPNTQVEASPVQKTASVMAIDYKSPHAEISVKNNILNHVQIKQMFVTGSTSSKPDSTARTTLAADMLLSPQQLQILEKAIVTSGFMGLEDNYGAKKGKDNLISTLAVSFQGKTKKVTFRRSPAFEKSPVSFKKVEANLLNLYKSGQ